MTTAQGQIIKNNMWAADKQMHFEAGAMIGSLTYAVVAETTNSKRKHFCILCYHLHGRTC